MPYYNTLMEEAIKAINEINDPESRVSAIAQILPFSKITADGETKPAKIISAEAAAVLETTVKDEAPVKKARAKKAKAEKAEKEAPTEAPEPAVEPAPEVAHKPLPVVKPSAEEIAKVEEAVDKVELILPSENETEEETQARYASLIKLYGDKPFAEILGSEDLAKYLETENEGIQQFRSMMLEKFGITVNPDGSETSDTDYSSADIDSLIEHYVHESDETAEDISGVKLTNFLNAFIPYLQYLYGIYQYEFEDIMAAGREMMSDKDFTLSSLNINNARALYFFLEKKSGKA